MSTKKIITSASAPTAVPTAPAVTVGSKVVSVPVNVYKDVFSADPAIVVRNVQGGKELSISPDALPSSAAVADHGARLDALDAARAAAFVVLADSSETITRAQGLRRWVTTLTAHRTKTISKTGALEGDVLTFNRTESAPYTLRLVDPDAGEVFALAAPGRVSLRLEGGDGAAGTWVVESSTVTNGSRRLNAKDFGAIGDGVTDDTAALQAFFDVLTGSMGQDVSFRYGFLPAGVYYTTGVLYLRGNNTNSTGFVLEGESFSSQAIGGSIIEYHGPSTDLGALTCVGVSGSCIRRINVNANTIAKYAGLATLMTGVDTSSENVLVEECMFYGPRNVEEGAAWGHGNITSEWAGGSDVAYWTFRDCKFYGSANLWNDPGYEPSSFAFRNSNNVLCTQFLKCFFNLAKVGMNNGISSNMVHCEWCDFNLIRTWAIIDNGWANCYRECYCEGSGGILAGTIGDVTLERCRFNVNSVARTYPSVLSADAGYQISHPNVRIVGGYYREFRHRRVISAIDVGTNTLTAEASAGNTPLTEGAMFWLWADNGQGAFPQIDPWSTSVDWNSFFYAKDVTSLGGDRYTFKLADALGTPYDILHAGSGVIRMYTPLRFIATKLHAEDANFDCGLPTYPDVIDQGITPVDGDGSFVAHTSGQREWTFLHCRNGQWNNFYRMANMTPSTSNPRIGVGTLYSHRHMVNRPGLDLVRTSILTVSALRASRVLGAATQIFQYFFIPARTRIVGMQVIVEEAFAGTGLATATIEMQLDPALGGVAGDMLPASNLMAVGGFGYTDAEFGSLLQRANLVHNGYIPAGFMSPSPPTISWVVYCAINLTGCTVAQLTAGKVSVYLKLEKLEAADKLIGFDMAGATGVTTI